MVEDGLELNSVRANIKNKPGTPTEAEKPVQFREAKRIRNSMKDSAHDEFQVSKSNRRRDLTSDIIFIRRGINHKKCKIKYEFLK